jgi:predicted DNA-binding transcriptional regulator AlpA
LWVASFATSCLKLLFYIYCRVDAAVWLLTVNLFGVIMDKLLDLDELAMILGRSPATIKRDIKRNPAAVPPRLNLPGTRLLRWRPTDVEIWLAEHVAGGQ